MKKTELFEEATMRTIWLVFEGGEYSDDVYDVQVCDSKEKAIEIIKKLSNLKKLNLTKEQTTETELESYSFSQNGFCYKIIKKIVL